MNSVVVTYVVGDTSLAFYEQVTDRLIHSDSFMPLSFLIFW